MTERLDDAPPRTWQSILAEVPEATPVGGLSVAPEPAASKVQRYARKLDRTDETPADVLAAIEYEVSEPATRETLDTMRAWRARQRKEMERLDELDAPDTRPWIRRKFDGFWDVFAYIAGGFAIMPLRGTESLDLSAAVAAGAALIAVVRVLAVQSGRTKGQKESRGMLLFPLAAMVIAPIALIVRLVLSRDMDEHGLLTFGGVGVLVLTAVVFTVTTLRAPTLAELVASAE